MKRALLVSALLIFACLHGNSQGFIRTDGTNLVNDNGKILLRGINLGGWLITEGYIMDYNPLNPTSHDHYWYHHVKDMVCSDDRVEELLELHRDNFITEADIALIAQAGFNHVRVPFMYNIFYDDATDTPTDMGFKYLDDVVQWCENHGIYAILDLHTAPGGQSTEHHANPETSSHWPGGFWADGTHEPAKAVCIDIWTRIATRYANNPAVAGYDLLNEPNAPPIITEEQKPTYKLRNYYIEATEAIRTVDENHVIYAEGNYFGSDIQWLFPVWDDNMAMSIHNYWTCVDRDVQVPPKWYDRGGEPGQIPMALENNVPIWMGEFGENSNNWNHDQVELAESDNVSWCVWTYKKTASSSSMVNHMWTQGIDYCLGASPCSGDTTCNTGNWNYGYWRVKEAWLGNRTAPTCDEAYGWIKEWILTGNTSNMGQPGNLVYESPDFVDALLREDFDERPKAYNDDQTVPLDPSECLNISALDYDLGDNDIGSSDKGIIHKGEDCGGGEPWNKGWQYRNDAVDIKAYWDNHNHHNRDTMIFDITGGEWVSYTINFPATGLYKLDVKAIGPMPFTMTVDGQDVTGAVTTNGAGPKEVDHCFQPIGGNEIVWTTFNDIPICGGERQVIFNFSGGGQFKEFCISRQSGDEMGADFESDKDKACPNETVTFTNTSVGVTGSTSYNWNFGEGASPATATGAGPHNVTYSTSGYKDIELTLNGTTCGKVRTILVDSVPNFTPTIEGDTLLCLGGEMIPFTAERMDDVLLYHWTLPSGLSLQTGNLSRSIRANIEGGDGYIGDITMRPEYYCGIADPITPFPVYVYGTPESAAEIMGDPPACGMGSTTFSVDDVTYATEYQWISDNQIQLPNPPVTGPEVTANINGSGRIGVIALNKCGESDTLWRYINMGAAWAVLDDVDIEGPTTDICPGDTVSYFVDQPNATSFVWTVPSGTTIIRGEDTQEIFVVFDGTPGTISVDMDNECNPNATPTTASLEILSFLNGTPPPSDITLTGQTCEGATVTLAVDPVAGALTWDVPFGYTIESGQGTNAIEVTIGANDGQISVSATSGCGASTPSTIDITVLGALVNADLTGDTAFCAGTTGVVYTLSPSPGAGTYTWTVPTGATIASGDGTESITVDFGAAGGDVSVTYAAGCGGDVTQSLTIDLSSAPDVSDIDGEAAVCANASGVVYTITPDPSGTGYSWTVPTGAFIASGDGTTSITVDFGASAGDVELEYVDACGSTINKTFTVSATSLAAAGPISGDTEVCASATGLVYSITPITGATSYTWNVPADATISAGDGTESITIDFGATIDQISVMPEFPCGTGDSAFIALTELPAVAAGPIAGPAGLCTESTGVTYEIDPVAGATDYTWVFPAEATLVSGQGTETLVLDFGTTSFTGTISVTPVGPCGDGEMSELEIAVGEGLTVESITGDSVVCPGETGVTFVASELLSATNYEWTVPAGAAIASGAGTQTITVNFGAVSGPVTVYAEGDCIDPIPVEFDVEVSADPDVISVTGDTDVCEGGQGSYTASPAYDDGAFNWTLPNGASVIGGSGPEDIIAMFGSQSGYVTVERVNACGVSTFDSVEVAIISEIVAGPVTGQVNVCQNSNGIIYSIDAVPGANDYTWTLPAGATIASGDGTNSISVDFAAIGGTIEVTPSGDCGAGTPASLEVTIDVPSSPGTISGASEFCPNASGVTYEILPVAGATSYDWIVPSDATIVSGQGTESIVVDFGLSDGSVQVLVDGECVDQSPVTFPVDVTEALRARDISGNTLICSGGGEESYSISAVPTATNYTWNVPSGATITSGQGTTSITVDLGTATSGDIFVVASGGCVEEVPADLTFEVVEGGGPSEITGESALCEGVIGVYSIDPVASATTYNWSVPLGAIIIAGAGTNEISVLMGNSSGDVAVTPSGGCAEETTVDFSVEVSSLPATGVILGPERVCKGWTGVQYEVQSSNYADSYSWTPPAQAVITAGQGAPSIFVDFGALGGMVVVEGVNQCGTGEPSTLSVTTALPGQTVTDFDGVEHTCESYDLDIPNLISPNGDGYNDTWIIGNLDLIGYYRLEIYNRNGHLIYSTDKYDQRWDGTWNDRDVPETAYYYVIHAEYDEVTYKGSVSVIRE